METEFVREVFLAHSAGFADSPDVATKGPLQVAFHEIQVAEALLPGLHTYE